MIAINDEPLTRKDFATTFTRKLVFDFEPETAIPKFYRGVEEVVFGPACMKIVRYNLHQGESERSDQADRVSSLFVKCLTAIASTGGSATVLHVRMHMVNRIDYHMLLKQLTRLKTAIPISYELFDIPIDWTTLALELTYTMQAVVHFVNGSALSRYGLAQDLANQIGEMLIYSLSVSASIVYPCDVPQIVLRPDELDSVDDTNEAAMFKICNLIANQHWPNQVTTPTKRLEFLKSRVSLVEAGFWPTSPQIATAQHLM